MSEEAATLTKLMHSVLFNDLILDEIIKNLSLSQKKHCRLVCKDWEREITRGMDIVFRKKFINFLSYYETEQSEHPTTNDNDLDPLDLEDNPRRKIIYFEKFKFDENMFWDFNLKEENFSRLHKLARVRQLAFKNCILNTADLSKIFEISRSTIEVLNFERVDYDRNSTRLYRNDESVIILPEIKKLTLESTYEKPEVVADLLTTCQLTWELSINVCNVEELDEYEEGFSFILNKLISLRPKNLKTLCFFSETISQTNLDLLKTLVGLSESKLNKIVFNNAVFSAEEIFTFFNTFASHFDLKRKKDSESEDSANTKFYRVKSISGNFGNLALANYLKHFPNLESLNFSKSNQNNFELEDGTVSEKLIELSYTCCGEPENIDVTRVISSSFPNLKLLELDIFMDNLNHFYFDNIFTRCQFLTILKIANEELLTDSILTGIDQNFIENELKRKSYRMLSSYELDSFPKKAGILLLKRLKNVTIETRKITDISVFFGFNKLRDLEVLIIPNARITESSLKLFKDNFEALTYLKIHSRIKTTGKKHIENLLLEKPFLDFNWQYKFRDNPESFT